MPGRRQEYHPINERFGVRDELLEARDDVCFQRAAGAILESFLLLQQHHELKGMDADTLRALWRAQRLINPRSAAIPATASASCRCSAARPTSSVRCARMNEYGVLGATSRVRAHRRPDAARPLPRAHGRRAHPASDTQPAALLHPELAHEFPLCSR
jgi:[protein-PII] uridylyltransferase